eukprot:776714-Rhodomonas_salina.1
MMSSVESTAIPTIRGVSKSNSAKTGRARACGRCRLELRLDDNFREFTRIPGTSVPPVYYKQPVSRFDPVPVALLDLAQFIRTQERVSCIRCTHSA